MRPQKSDIPSETPQTALRVLVVDDSRLQRRILTASLTKWGFDVVEAASGREALKKCAATPPDLVLSDWMMPEMDGLEFCRIFRNMPTEQYGYFILLTSKSDKNDIAHGLDIGADDFLTKPVNPAELRARLLAGERILRMERELTKKNRLINTTLTELQALYNSLDNDLLEAKKLQQSLVRERFRDFGTAAVSLMLHPSGHVGGDLVGFYPVSDTRIGLYSIDVSGHGISSALMTARLAGYLSPVPEQNVALQRTPSGSYQPRPPADVVARLNQLVFAETKTEHYFTLMLADVDLETGRVCLVQAGHPHPVVQRRNGNVEQWGTGGLPVGLMEGARYQQFDITLAPGDRLLILSDGVTECPDPANTLLGEDGLARILHKLSGVAGTAFLEALMWELSSFSQGRDFPDDISGALLEMKR